MSFKELVAHSVGWRASKDFDAFLFVFPDIQIQGHGVAQGNVFATLAYCTRKMCEVGACDATGGWPC